MTARLFLVRHGETEYNRRRLALGRADVPLNETGRRQAVRLREALAGARSPRSTPVRLSAPSIPPRHRRGPRKRGAGREWPHRDGHRRGGGPDVSEFRKQFPALAQNWGGADGPTFRMPGGERLVDVQRRAVDAIEGLAARHQDETFCAVTHNFVILSFLASVLGIELAQFRRLRHGVAAIAEVDFRPGRSRVVRLNDPVISTA